LGEFIVFQMYMETSGALMKKSKIFGLGVIHFNEVLFRNVIQNTVLQYKFKEEGFINGEQVALRDLYNSCNPFIEENQNFFLRFLEKYPYSKLNREGLTTNSNEYISSFNKDLEEFITNGSYKLGETKALL